MTAQFSNGLASNRNWLQNELILTDRILKRSIVKNKVVLWKLYSTDDLIHNFFFQSAPGRLSWPPKRRNRQTLLFCYWKTLLPNTTRLFGQSNKKLGRWRIHFAAISFHWYGPISVEISLPVNMLHDRYLFKVAIIFLTQNKCPPPNLQSAEDVHS